MYNKQMCLLSWRYMINGTENEAENNNKKIDHKCMT